MTATMTVIKGRAAASKASAPAKKKRLDWIDIAKGLGILLMIVGHTFVNESLARKLVFSFHMPLFFILAGYTFRVKPMKEVIVSSAKRLLIPYVLVYWTIRIIVLVQQPEVGAGDIFRAFGGFVYASGTDIYDFGFPAAGVIWFLVALFCARVTLNLLTGIFERRGISEWVQLAFWVIVAAIGIYIGEFAQIKLPLSYDLALVACLFMYVGYLAKKHDVMRLFKRWWTFPIALAIWVLCIRFSYLELAARIYDIAAFSIIGAFAGSYMVYQVSYLVDRFIKPIKKPLVWLGQNSMLLLCIHAFDWMFAPWLALPFMETAPAPYLISGCLRAGADIAIATMVKKV